MAIGVFITYKVLDFADLTVDGTMATGGAVFVMLMLSGCNLVVAMFVAVIAGMLAGLDDRSVPFRDGHSPAILSGILTQLSLYSINLWIMGFQANQGINVRKYTLFVSALNVRALSMQNPIFRLLILMAALIGFLYWFFGTELGCALRATGANPAMARAQGINTNLCKILGLMISNGIVALALNAARAVAGLGGRQYGQGASIVIGLAAVIISEVVFGKLFNEFCAEARGRGSGRGDLLYRDSDRALAGLNRQIPPEAPFRDGGCNVPRNSVLEKQNSSASEG